MLQSEALDLAGAMCLVGATLKTLHVTEEEKYIQIHHDANNLADSLNIHSFSGIPKMITSHTDTFFSILKGT